MKLKTCCFTGHRHIAETKITDIRKTLEDKIATLVRKEVTDYLNGGALGFDLLAAETIIDLKIKFPQLHLSMILPCKNQNERWNINEKVRYNKILQSADNIIYFSEKYYTGCMLDRNRYMVNHSDYCIAYLNQPYGGTFYTVSYAKKNNLNLVNIADIY